MKNGTSINAIAKDLAKASPGSERYPFALGLADLVTVLPGYAGPAYGVPTAEMVSPIQSKRNSRLRSAGKRPTASGSDFSSTFNGFVYSLFRQ